MEVIAQALGLRKQDLWPASNDAGAAFASRPPRIPPPSAPSTARKEDPEPQGSLTLAEYAEAKRLPLDFLQLVGLSDTTWCGRPAVIMPYRAEDGSEVRSRVRTSMYGRRRFMWDKGTGTCLYGLDHIGTAREKRYVALLEGESDCHTLWCHGFPALGLPGATNWKEERDAHLLDGIESIYVVFEPDKGGRELLKKLAASSIAKRVRVIHLSELVGVKDPSALHIEDPDGFKAIWRDAMAGAAPLLQRESASGEESAADASSRPACDPLDGEVHDGEDPPEGSPPVSRRSAPSQATRLVQMVEGRDVVDLFHAASGEPYMTFPGTEGGIQRRETARLGSQRTRDWLTYLYYRAFGQAPGSKAIQDAINTLSCIATADGPERAVYLRTGWHGQDIYVDLGGPDWSAVRVHAGGWEVVTDAPVKFRRTTGMRPLPTPAAGGSLNELRPFLNVRDEDGWALVAGWLTAALNPEGEYPLLCPSGPQGTGKSTVTRMLRALIDPSIAPIRPAPKDLEAVNVAMKNSHMQAMDNITSLPQWLSDALCRMSTGGYDEGRRLYTNDEPVYYGGTCPTIVNGINTIVTADDLMDRTILLPLAPIPNRERRPITEIMAEFEAAAPRIFGGLLDAMAAAIRSVDSLPGRDWPRLGAFARWATAGESAYAEAGTFMRAYMANIRSAVDVSIEISPVASALVRFMDARENQMWQGQLGELHEELTRLIGDRAAKAKGWPANAQKLSQALGKSQKSLRDAGIVWTKKGAGGLQRYTFVREKSPENLVEHVEPSETCSTTCSTTNPAKSALGGAESQDFVEHVEQNPAPSLLLPIEEKERETGAGRQLEKNADFALHALHADTSETETEVI